MIFNSIQKQLQRFNLQRKYYKASPKIQSKVRVLYPKEQTKKSPLTQITEEFEQKTKTVIQHRKLSQASSEKSSCTVSKHIHYGTQVLSPIQFSKCLNEKTEGSSIKSLEWKSLKDNIDFVNKSEYINSKEKIPFPQPQLQKKMPNLEEEKCGLMPTLNKLTPKWVKVSEIQQKKSNILAGILIGLGFLLLLIQIIS